ncbi:hypothetical protein M514_17853 [Trichuris suis]|uniref:Uncharacterized protein n=1 Tax=Trichuris suis TaxID=68888 RepID=A0A085NKJ8_9BILA|nr:hypothetical protein M514_17853 [Trichuris suis]
MKSLTRYCNAVERLNGVHSNGSPTLDPQEAMDQAAQTSAIAQHAAHCEGRLQATVLCRESQFMIRKIKEALYIMGRSDVGYSATRGALRRPATPDGALQRKPIYD